MLRKAITLTMLVSAPFLSARAQNAVGVHEGQRVRVSSSTNKDVVGVVRQVRADSILVFTEPAGATLAIANSELTNVDVSRGRSATHGAKRGALWGGAIGAGLGLILIGSIASAGDDYAYSTSDNYALEIAANMVGGGLVWGAVIGAFVKAERWDHASIQPRVSSSSLGISIGLR